MVQQMRWVERTFEFGQPIGAFPCILERFRGTPARMEDMIRSYPQEILRVQLQGGWSIQEHAGHLWDLEELGERRLQEFLARVPVLSAADMGNRKTYEAKHNNRPMKDILREFRSSRNSLVAKLEELGESQAAISCLHPRLNQPMRLIDWVHFMTEHDDHHLARMSGIAMGLRNKS